VKSKLIAEKPSNLTRVSVKTDKGVVYLDGAVNTPEQKARAQQIARDTSGVRVVVDNLQVQPK